MTALTRNFSQHQSKHIRQCLNQLKNWEWTLVNYKRQQLCRNNEDGTSFSHWSPVRYALYKQHGQLVISAKRNLTYIGPEKYRPLAEEMVTRAEVCVEAFYARFGLKLNLELQFANWLSSLVDPININVHHRGEKWTALNWTLSDPRSATLYTDQRFCSFVAHELSHTLGLPDTYPDYECPDRPPHGPLNSVMRAYGMDIDKVILAEDHIQMLVEPLCPSEEKI